jgi:membrane associated rhomboid family serine protease
MFPFKDNIPNERFPVVTVVLIAINAIAYLLAIRHGGSFFGGPSAAVQARYGAIPYDLAHSGADPSTVLTSMFMHASFLQLFASMLFLAIFGPTVEDALGRTRFLALYLLGGLLVLGLRVLANPASTVPVLGAAGAITAILAAYIVRYPRARVISLVFIVFFFTIVEVPAVLLLGLWLAVQLCFGLTGPAFA